MPNLYVKKTSAKPIPWTHLLTPGASLANLRTIYKTKGDVTIGTDTSLPCMQDGPIVVHTYDTLTVNAKLTTLSRCRGLVLLCKNLVVGASGSITMTARGAAGQKSWAQQNIVIPSAMNITGKGTSYEEFLAWLYANGYAIFDPSLYSSPLPGMGDVTADYTGWPALGATIVSNTGVGAGGAVVQTNTAIASTVGVVGGAGIDAPGGGGTGAVAYGGACIGAPGTVWGGGPGSGAVSGISNVVPPDKYGGRAGADGSNAASFPGGAGNPSTRDTVTNNGTGGLLAILVENNVTVTTGHVISSNGMPGEGGGAGGGGSGGGKVLCAYGGTLTGTLNMTATGGLGGGSPKGGDGGAGAVSAKTFSEMGW